MLVCNRRLKKLRLHGHNCKVQLTVEGGALDPAGLLRDFKKLKAWKRTLFERLDQCFLNALEPIQTSNASAENIAR